MIVASFHRFLFGARPTFRGELFSSRQSFPMGMRRVRWDPVAYLMKLKVANPCQRERDLQAVARLLLIMTSWYDSSNVLFFV